MAGENLFKPQKEAESTGGESNRVRERGEEEREGKGE